VALLDIEPSQLPRIQQLLLLTPVPKLSQSVSKQAKGSGSGSTLHSAFTKALRRAVDLSCAIVYQFSSPQELEDALRSQLIQRLHQLQVGVGGLSLLCGCRPWEGRDGSLECVCPHLPSHLMWMLPCAP
jgi:hypothetical protein